MLSNDELLNSDPEYYLDNTLWSGHIEIGDNGLSTEMLGGNTEIGDVITPWDAFESEETRVGMNTEIGALAVREVIRTARDNRSPAPPMRAVPVDSPPIFDNDDWITRDVVLGAAEATGADQFPLFSSYLQRFGAGSPSRYVRIDDEDSYRAFRAQNSPDMAEYLQAVMALEDRLARHEADPYAHDLLASEVQSVSLMGEQVAALEADKDVEVRLPARFGPPLRGSDLIAGGRIRGTWSAWLEGDTVCASLMLPGPGGEVKICTGAEPLKRCLEEINRYAVAARVPAAAVVGALPAMGCCLGAATVLKEMAKAAAPMLTRPEARGKGGQTIRIEPKHSPALCAFLELGTECARGNPAACDEWTRMGKQSPAPVRQLMQEAAELLKRAA